MKNYIIFFDNDGVTSSWSTWGNDINLFEDKRLKDIDIYRWNYLDRVCRQLKEDVTVYAVCISSWCDVFESEKNRNDFTKVANLKKIQILYDEDCIFKGREPQRRINMIKKYLSKYNAIDYIIFDDEFSDYYKRAKLKNHIITDAYDGIRYEDLWEVRRNIESWGLNEKSIQARQMYEETLHRLIGCSV